MLLVIFGAGASYDSVAHLAPLGSRGEALTQERPPLANQLFDDRPIFVDGMRRFPDCIPLISPLRRNGVVVERELAKLKEQSTTFPRALRELAAIRFYLHFALWECQKQWHAKHHGITNFAALLREIERWRFEANEHVCFVTFNYDTMLEQAMELVLGCTFSNFSKYIFQNNFTLIKLHGSIDWGREVDALVQQRSPQSIINMAAELTLKESYRRVVQHPMVFEDGSVGFPALSIPVEHKDEFSCPPEHVEALARCIPTVNKIMTIGWRATEADFLKMLKGRLTGLTCTPDLMVVSGNQDGAGETRRNLGIRNPTNHEGYVSIETGFTGLINGLDQLESFLRRNPPELNKGASYTAPHP